ncbi:hypothetical protein FA13DRAFT_1789417 [Coprinellus micaceus]|uniref:F-box domain-containing protein n=1 Tax=Coprinellus micaceus TaxID=71717 RepID=A0A4Y7TJX8_COPMI|nr:hypothetical protein FA13DRAFT_1789417 [Coprinellus micaceus]
MAGAGDPLFRDSLRAMTSLQYLSLCLSSINATRFINVLQQLPQLSTLDIQLRRLENCDDDPLHVLNNNPSILPNLLTLILDVGPAWTSSFSAENLESFIETGVFLPLSQRLREYIRRRNLGVAITIKDERHNLEDRNHWVDRDEELAYNWPESRNAFVTCRAHVFA